MFSISEEFRRGQCSLEVITEDGIMIYNDLSINALMCWNTAKRPAIENTQLIYQVRFYTLKVEIKIKSF